MTLQNFTLGTFAQQGVAAGSFESIATNVLSTTAASVTFNSIPSTYAHLQLRVFALGSSATAYDSYLRVNGDSGSNYSWHDLYGNGTSAASRGYANQTQVMVDTDGTRTTYGNAVIIDILDYANTNKYKTFRNLTGLDTNGGGAVSIKSGLWRNTNAITSLTISIGTGTFAQYSHFALYGIKAA